MSRPQQLPAPSKSVPMSVDVCRGGVMTRPAVEPTSNHQSSGEFVPMSVDVCRGGAMTQAAVEPFHKQKPPGEFAKSLSAAAAAALPRGEPGGRKPEGCAFIGTPRLRNTEQPRQFPTNYWGGFCVLSGVFAPGSARRGHDRLHTNVSPPHSVGEVALDVPPLRNHQPPGESIPTHQARQGCRALQGGCYGCGV